MNPQCYLAYKYQASLSLFGIFFFFSFIFSLIFLTKRSKSNLHVQPLSSQNLKLWSNPQAVQSITHQFFH